MAGAVFYASKYGSSAQYARWIGEDTGLPVLDTSDPSAIPAGYDFVVLVTPVLYYKLLIRGWVKRHRDTLAGMPVILVTVSGAPPGPKLAEWIGDSLPGDMVARLYHVALRGRQTRKDLTVTDRIALYLAALRNPDPAARDEEMHGFDYMDRASIAPVVDLVAQFRAGHEKRHPYEVALRSF